MPAVQEVLGSIPDCDALIASRSGPSLLSSGCSPTLYAEDVGGPGQAPTVSFFLFSTIPIKPFLFFIICIKTFKKIYLQESGKEGRADSIVQQSPGEGRRTGEEKKGEGESTLLASPPPSPITSYVPFINDTVSSIPSMFAN